MFGLSFLNSLFLWGLAAAAIPVIIHLVKRSRAVNLPFAAMRFLQPELNERYKSQNLKQFILLLMRITVFALLALAFARPYLEDLKAPLIWANQRQSAVILIDNSYSMGFADNFPVAIDKARALLTTFGPGDEVTVMQFSDRSDAILGGQGNFATLAGQLPDRLQLSYRSTDYSQALQAAEALLLESRHPHKSIYMISDFHQTGWTNLYQDQRLQPGIELQFIQVAREGYFNLAVKDVLATRPMRKKNTVDLLARVGNDGGDAQTIKLDLHLNDRSIASKQVKLQPYEEQVVMFTRVPLPRGVTHGFVAIASPHDPIAADNRYYFVLQPRGESRILAVNGEPSARDRTTDELFFVERAVNLPGTAKYNLQTVPYRQLDGIDFSDFRAVLLANIEDLSRDTIERLDYFVRNGGGLIITLGDRVRPHIYNRLFRDLTPGRLLQLAVNSVNRDHWGIFAEIDYQHPIFRLFADPGQSDPGSAQFYQYFIAEPVAEHHIISSFDDGNPAILERKVGAGKVILLTSSVDTEWNNLPVKGIFLPLLYQTFAYVMAEKKGQKSYLVGNPVPVTPGTDSPTRSSSTVIDPAGEETVLKTAVFDKTDMPGIYVIAGERKQPKRYFAVNVDARSESEGVLSSPVELDAKVHKLSSAGAQTAAIGPRQQHAQQEKNQNLWRMLIIAAVLLLLGETYLANRTYR